ncbi:NAD(P)-dependent oxidoreductase [Salinivibrio sp. KP-1]|uniref:NAD-dependent epimerase/dehydratase family protein n=1 Tax=Salinivibrio sp. KP-1 TaxID=1406902 RepID=UPI0006147E54|nr:NAD(P)-dependent oxidoreductase [Salinivibrio sp. KP-1]KKA44107.1 NAD-binding protein [Salinivibrio sp. KP-1]
MKKLLVLGASGSLGKGVIEYLKSEYCITATYTSNEFEERDILVRHVDITNPESLDKLGGDFDAVVMIAGAMPATMKGYNPQKYIDVNVTGTLNVLEYCRKSGIRKFIYIMTFSDVAYKFYNGVPIESDDIRGLNLTGDHAVYSISKVAACDLVEHYRQEYGLQTITFRIPTVYCADHNFNYYVNGELKTKAYIQMIKSIVSHGKVELWGNPENAKDMPYIKDFSRLIALGVEHPTAQGVFNAGTGQPVTLKELVDTMIEVFSESQSVNVIARPEKPSQPNFTFDMKKTKEVFGFESQWSVKNMFEDIRDKLGLGAFKK